MLDRDLRMQALTLATQLPDDEISARKVHAMLGELIEQWIYRDSVIQSSALPKTSGSPASIDARYIGKDD